MAIPFAEDDIAVRLNGTNAYVDLGNPANLNISGTITIQAWIKPSAPLGLQVIVAHGYVQDPAGEVYLRLNGYTYQVGSWNGADHVVTAPIPQSDLGRWTHLCGVYDGSNWIIYSNGRELARQADATGAVPVAGPWAIGARGGGGERFFQGQIRNVALWKTARTPAQIAQDMRDPGLAADPDLRGFWPLNEGAETTARDYSLGAHNGTYVNADWAYPFALDFNGTTAYVDLTNPSTLRQPGNISIQAWIKLAATDGIRNIVAHGYSRTPDGEVYLRLKDGQYQVGSWNGPDHAASAPIPPVDVGRWVHLCGVHDGFAWVLYRNGAEIARTSDSTGVVPVAGSWAIGARGGGGERFFQGQIRHVAMWNRGLTPGDVRNNYAQRVLSPTDSLLVGYWPCTEGTGTQLPDHSLNPAATTIVNATWAPITEDLPAIGVVPGDEQFVRFADNALALDGTSTYVDLGNPPVLNLQGRLTIQAWINPAATSGFRNIVAHGYSAAGEVYLRLKDGQYQVGTWDGTNDHVAVGGNAGDDVGRWVHLCGTYDGSAWILYRNGLEIGRTASTIGGWPVNAPWAIGAKGGGGERFFQGQIRHVALWNYALNILVVQGHAFQPILNPAEAGLVGYWPLDEGTGTAAGNRVDPALAGTISNPAWAEVTTAHATPYLIAQARLMQDYRPDPAQPGQMIEFAGYRTVISARTAQGAALPNTMIALWGTDRAIAHFPDGSNAVLDPARPVTRTTNALGELSFAVEALGQLTCPPIKARAAFMAEQERLFISPDRQAHETLSTLTGAQLRGQAPPPGPLSTLPRPTVFPASVTAAQADAAAAAMRHIVSAVVTHDVQPTAGQVATRDLDFAAPPAPRVYDPLGTSSRALDLAPDPLRDDIVMHLLPVDQPVRRVLNVAGMDTQAWVLDLRAGTFTPRAADSGARDLAAPEMVYLDDASRLLDGLPPRNFALTADDGSRGLFDDISNFFNHTIPDAATTAYHETANFFTNTVPSAANTVGGGVTQVYNTTVAQTTQGFQQIDTAIKSGSTIVLSAVSTAVQVVGQVATQVITGIRVLVNTVINGVQQVLSLVLETVEQATQFVGTLFESLGAKIQDLLDYIKALFNWGDILATEQVIEHALLELKRVAAEAVASLAQGAYVDQGITRLRTLIDTNFDTWIAALGGPAGGGAAPTANMPPQDVQSKYVQSLFSDNIQHAGSGLDAFQWGPALIGVADELTTRLQTVGGNLWSAETFQNSGLMDLLRHPENLLSQRGLADLLSTIRPLLDAALGVAGALIHAILELLGIVLDAILALLTTRINIPILTDFCESVVFQGRSQLTILSLVSLLAAIPLTVVYKLASGQDQPPLHDSDIQMLRDLHWSTIWSQATAALSGSRDLEQEAARDLARPDDAAWNAAGWALSFVGVALGGVLGAMTLVEDASLNIAQQTPFGIVKVVLQGVSFIIGLPLDVVRDGFTNTPSALNFGLWLSGLIGLVSAAVSTRVEP